jgi:hypothetical protein
LGLGLEFGLEDEGVGAVGVGAPEVEVGGDGVGLVAAEFVGEGEEVEEVGAEVGVIVGVAVLVKSLAVTEEGVADLFGRLAEDKGLEGGIVG